MYPEEVKLQRIRNLSYSKSTEKARNQGGDFLLEQKIQRQKMIPPRGIVTSTTWQRISRSIDKIDGILGNSSNILGTEEETRTRTIILNRETVEWRAILRYSKFLNNNSEECVLNIYGEKMGNDLLDFNLKLNDKRLEYWQFAKEKTPLENIRYQVIRTSCTADENSTYQSSDESEYECDSDEE